MRITVIYGNTRRETTYNLVKIIKNNLLKNGDYVFMEIFLPEDLPDFCMGCFRCFLNGEENCPHSSFVQPAVKKLISADGIIMASPVYGMNITAAMKNFIDHTCYLWMPHRPEKEMFSKIGFIVTSTAGAGIKNTLKAMRYPMNYWGINRIIQYGKAVKAAGWNDVKNKEKIEKELMNKSLKLHKLLIKRKKLKSRLYTKALFYIMKNLVKNVYDEDADKKYWRKMGWIEKKTPLR